MRITNRADSRASIYCQGLKNDHPPHWQTGQTAQAQCQRHHNKQSYIIGNHRGQQGGKEHHGQRQLPLAVHAAEQPISATHQRTTVFQTTAEYH